MQNSACLTTFLSAMLIGLNVFSGSCIPKADWSEIYFLSKLSLPFYAFVFTSAENMLLLPGLYTCAKKRSVAKSDENIIVEGERSIKAVEKDHSTTIVASLRSTGATVVGSINVTEFWQGSKFYYCAVAKWILQCHRNPLFVLFCDNYFCTCFLHWCAVFHWKSLKLRLFHGCSKKVQIISRWRKQNKELLQKR